MRSFATVLAGGLLAHNAAAQIAGFNSGSTLADGTIKQLADFEAEFKAAAGLVGAPAKFNSVRLYTMVQGGTTSDPLSAFQAAINTNTTMLLGIWCSGTTSIQNDLDALSKAIKGYGQKFTDLVVGISVGSEDLYRNSATGVTNKAGVGADPSVVANFIGQVRSTVKGTALEKTPIGHVDTWDVWGNSSNQAVLDAIDFLGTDAYPYFESNRGDNSIGNALSLWNEAFSASKAAANGKPVWITETGWPSAGPNWGNGVASVANAKQYWDDVGCTLFGQVNTWWYTLRDSNPADEAQFAISSDLSTTPKWNLTCSGLKKTSPSSSAGSSAAASGTSTSASGSAATGSTSGSAAASSPSTTNNAAAGNVAPQSLFGGMVLAALAALAL